MAATGFTPIQLYRTTTPAAQPLAANLADGELAINTADKKLYAKDSAGAVFLLADASSGSTTATNLAGGAAGSLPYQSGANATVFRAIGTAGQVLQVNAGATAPEWVSSSGTGDVARVTSPSFTTPSLGAATALSINSLTITTSTGTFTLANGKTLTVNNSLTLNGTDATVMTFPSTNATLARTDAAQSFTGTQTFLSNPVLDAGTANGVLYLNASKTATSGSALTFNGTELATTGNIKTTGGTGGVGTISFASNYLIAQGGTNGVLFRDDASNNLFSVTPTNNFFYISGSEAMRLNSSGNLGIGTSSWPTAQRLRVAGGDVGFEGQFLYLVNANANIQLGASQNSRIINTDSTNTLDIGRTGASSVVTFSIASAEQMRLTSTGLGIGTSSPGAKLEVAAGTGFPTARFTRVGTAAQTGSADIGMSQLGFPGSTNADTILRSSYGFGLQVNSAGSLVTALVADLSGNIGVGATPSAWSGLAPALQVQRASIVTSSASAVDTYFSSNAFYDGSWKYILSAPATQYMQNASGDHRWRVAASGTAGNPISFTQAMTLEANGNLGIGTTSPGRKLHVVSNNPLRMGQASDYFDFVQSNNNLWSWLSDSSIICLQMNGATGAVVISGLLNTTATDGFLYVPTCAGTPTGTPTTYTGRAPIVIDTTNNKLYFYSGGQWRDAGP